MLSVTPYSDGSSLVDVSVPCIGEGEKRTPCCVVFVVDNSGSMMEAAEAADEAEKYGWSRLDVTKHALQTFVSMMEEEDRACVVSFSGDAKVVKEWSPCSSSAKPSFVSSILSVRPEGATNLQEGLKVGFSQFRYFPGIAVHSLHVVLLTDGQPSYCFHPARGNSGYFPLVEGLRENVYATTGKPVSLTTIAIGNASDSSLMQSFSKTFLHMPDPGSIAPFMINLASRILSVASLFFTPLSSPTLRLETECLLPAISSSPVSQIETGPLVFGQKRTFYVSSSLCLSSLCEGICLVGEKEAVRMEVKREEERAPDERLRKERCRAEAVSMLRMEAERPFSQSSESFPSGMEGPLWETFDKEVRLGFSNRSTWGKHYFLSLACGLEQERRTNFRDAALQEFVTELEEEITGKGEEAFSSLKPPPPSLSPHSFSSTYAPPASMPETYLRGGGCFGEESSVLLAGRVGGEVKKIKVGDVKKGDLVVTKGGPKKVECVTFLLCPESRAELVKIGEGFFTPWHPVFSVVEEGKWCFAKDVSPPSVVDCAMVYNLVMEEKGSPPLVGGVEAAPLGHGMKGDVIGHSFWGEGVLPLLRSSEGWENGSVDISPLLSTR